MYFMVIILNPPFTRTQNYQTHLKIITGQEVPVHVAFVWVVGPGLEIHQPKTNDHMANSDDELPMLGGMKKTLMQMYATRLPSLKLTACP